MIEKRDQLIGFNVTQTEKDMIEEASKASGKRKADYARDIILGRAKKDLARKGKQ